MHLKEGIPTTISIGIAGLVCEVEVTPPAIDGGENIPQDCMRSGIWGISWPRYRKRLMPFTTVVSWDPDVYGVNFVPVLASVQVGMNQYITLTFPDGNRIGYYAVVNKFEPGVLKDGERPTATITISPTLMHPTTGAVVPPAYN